MNINRKAKQLNLVLVALIFLLPAAAKADPIVITLDPSHTVTAGSTVTFQGTFSNLGSPGRSIPGVTITFSGAPALFTFDPDAFFAAVPFIVNPGFTTGIAPVNFFVISVSALATPGTYNGSFAVNIECDPEDRECVPPCDPTNPNCQPQNSATRDFTLIVQGPQTAVPEPATMFLLATGVGGAAFAKWRAKRKRQSKTRS